MDGRYLWAEGRIAPKRRGLAMYRLGWFSTGRDPAARELLRVVMEAITQGVVPAEISFVFSNREPGEAYESDEFFRMVRGYGIPLVTFSSRSFLPELRRRGRRDPEALSRWRILYDREVMERLRGHPADLYVLSGYMLIVGDEMCREYNMINLHPAEPGGPKGTWQEVIWELIKKRAERTGVMMHLVTERLDEGPPVTYCTFPIRGGVFDSLWDQMERKLREKPLEQIVREEGEAEPLFSEIRRQGVKRELPLIVRTLRAFARGEVEIREGMPFSGGRFLERGYDLTEEVERAVREGKAF